VMYW